MSIFAPFAFLLVTHPKLRVGDLAPPLPVAACVQWSESDFSRGNRVKVVEFWATWCMACSQSAPEMNQIAKKFGDRVAVVGMASLEVNSDPYSSIPLVESFLDEGKVPMHYDIAVDTEKCDTFAKWMTAAGLHAIPCAFVVGKDGRIAWIGHPDDIADPVGAAVEGVPLAQYQHEAARPMREAAWAKRKIVNSILDAISRHDWALANRLAKNAVAGNLSWGGDLAGAVRKPLVLRRPELAEYYGEVLANNIIPIEPTFGTAMAWLLVWDGYYKLPVVSMPHLHPEIAVRLAEKGVKIGPPPDATSYEVLGMAYGYAHRYQDALRAFHWCLAHPPADSQVFRNHIQDRTAHVRWLMKEHRFARGRTSAVRKRLRATRHNSSSPSAIQDGATKEVFATYG